MARRPGTLTLSSNIEPRMAAPLDARGIVPLKTDLTTSGTFPYAYIGMTVVALDVGKLFILINEDTTDPDSWVEVGTGDVKKALVTTAQYDALPDTKLTDGVMYFISDAPGGGGGDASGGLPSGGTTGQILIKQSATDGDADWSNTISSALTIGARNGTSGTASLANGGGLVASGEYSHAEGAGTTASGNYSHSEGAGSTASGAYSHAEGNGRASGEYSHAEGASTTASGDYSHAEGGGTTASGTNSHAEGLNTKTTTTALGAHAEGNSTIAGYNNQHVQGRFNNNKSTSAFEIGNGTADNARSNALEVTWDGDLTASGDYTNGSGNKLGKKLTATVSGTTVIFTDNSITATAIIDDLYISASGPFTYTGYSSVVFDSSTNTLTYTLSDNTLSGSSAIIFVK